MAKLISGTRIYGTGTVDTQLFVSGTNAASSTQTGALQVIGGVGIGGSLYAGNIYSNGVQLTAGGGGGSAGLAFPTALGSVYAYTTATCMNVNLGYCAGNTTMTGSNNVAIGCNSLKANTIGSNNFAVFNFIYGKNNLFHLAITLNFNWRS